MRARLAIASSGQACQLREIILRHKAPEFLAASPKGTVPVIVKPDGTVLEESLDIMFWALEENDPENWLSPDSADLSTMRDLIARCESEFKIHLDRYKYAGRYPDSTAEAERDLALKFLFELDEMLSGQKCLFGQQVSLADMAIAPFVRQFANVDRDWFGAQLWPDLQSWLTGFLDSQRFLAIMDKHSKWVNGDVVTMFPANSSEPGLPISSIHHEWSP